MRTRKKRSFIYCWDGDDFGYLPEKASEQELVDKVFSPLVGTSVDTVFFLLGCGHFAEYQSELLKPLGEGQDYHFNNIFTYKRYANVKHLLDQQQDPAEILIRAARERNLDAFFSFRLNDIHDHWAANSDFMPTFKKENPHWLNPKEWFPDFHGRNEMTTALNYSDKDVRDFRFNILKEVMVNHDFDGIELDFMRSPFYFHWDKGLTSTYIMTDFVRSVRELLDELGNARGKTIELAVRVCTTVIGSKMAGFDVEDWARKGLVDIVIAGTGGMNIDTLAFKEILQGTGVSFFPCLYGEYERTASSDEVMRGIAEVLLSEEPDGIYAFNTYPDERSRIELMKQIGSLETLKGFDKTYIVDMDYDYILTKEEWRYQPHLPATLGETVHEGLVIPIRAGEKLDAYSQVQAHLKIWIKDWSAEDKMVFRFNGREMEAPVIKAVAGEYGQCWLTWELNKREIHLKNDVYIQLLERNIHLKRYVPSVVQRINIEVRFG
ncbi:hypothetical protein [Paenibacillus eucommiae]|uniref:Glycosyl hydrolase-like 10 domain-containing protein n=1 Tax=Paenibacillus eucommiae TaxID=1355755 RepID=A0ABS4J4J7_9BACL|nr:hypothetical protein [Paenibacillus eucommiae]MBP1994740.1 hypothetical protein [Paenibacillus eucommiae]